MSSVSSYSAFILVTHVLLLVTVFNILTMSKHRWHYYCMFLVKGFLGSFTLPYSYTLIHTDWKPTETLWFVILSYINKMKMTWHWWLKTRHRNQLGLAFYCHFCRNTTNKQTKNQSNYVVIGRTVPTWFSINLAYTSFVTIE